MPKAQGSDNNPACLLPVLQGISTLCLKISLVPYSCLKTPVRQETGIFPFPEPPVLGQAGTWAAWELWGGLEAWMWLGLRLPLSDGLAWCWDRTHCSWGSTRHGCGAQALVLHLCAAIHRRKGEGLPPNPLRPRGQRAVFMIQSLNPVFLGPSRA